jgi:hypothetical protein
MGLLTGILFKTDKFRTGLPVPVIDKSINRVTAMIDNIARKVVLLAVRINIKQADDDSHQDPVKIRFGLHPGWLIFLMILQI